MGQGGINGDLAFVLPLKNNLARQLGRTRGRSVCLALPGGSQRVVTPDQHVLQPLAVFTKLLLPGQEEGEDLVANDASVLLLPQPLLHSRRLLLLLF